MRLVTDGVEFGDMLPVLSSSGASVSTTQKRSGSYSYRLSGYQSNIKYSFGGLISEFYCRVCVYRAAIELSNFALFEFRNGSNYVVRGTLNTGTGKIAFVQGFFQDPVLTTDDAIPLETWTMVEMHWIKNGANGTLEVKFNGVLDVNSRSGDVNAGESDCDNLYIGYIDGGTYMYLDDIGINDGSNTDGLGDNGWLGDGHIELLMPNGSGYSSQWTGSDGNSVNNYALVDDIPPSGADYVKSSTTGEKDGYTFPDFDATGKIIKRVWVEGRGYDVAANGSEVKLGIRIDESNYVSDGIALDDDYNICKGDYYKTNPSDSSDWSDTALNSAEIILETG